MIEKIMVAIPMYNCQQQIPRVLSQFDEETQKLFVEILIIDNGSRDKSVEYAKSAAAHLKHVPVKVLRNDENYSLGGSLKVAFNYCLARNHDYCLILHGDDQADIRDIIPFLRSGEFRQYSCMFGSRFAKGARVHGYSWIRILGNKLLNLLISGMKGRQIQDLGSGLNLYKAGFLAGKRYLQFPNSLTFDVYHLLYSLRQKVRIRFFPISWREVDQTSNAKPFAQGLHILWLVFSCLYNESAVLEPQDNQFSRLNYSSKEM